MNLSVVVPAYNEGKTISRNLQIIDSVLKKSGLSYEIIGVDDGSSDNTYDEMRKVSGKIKKIRVFKLEKNMGKGAAIVKGAKNAEGSFVSFIDADLEIDPSYLPKMYQKALKENLDMVILQKEGRTEFPFKRRILSNVYSKAIKLLFRLPVKQTQIGCKLFSKEIVRHVVPKIITYRYVFDLELVSYSKKKGFSIGTLPAKIMFRRESTKINFKMVYTMFVDTIKVFFNYWL